MTYKIVLADDHQFLTEGIESVLKSVPELDIIGSVHDGTELMKFLQKEIPALVIMDLNMPVMDGITALKLIKENYESIKVIILTNYHQPELVDELKILGANGFLVKNCKAEELKKCIRDVLAGNNYYLYTSPLPPKQDSNYYDDDFLKKYQLTPREVDIIKLVSKGMSSKEIAENLYLSEFTVQTHRRNIFKKLDIKNVAGLLNFVKKTGLIL